MSVETMMARIKKEALPCAQCGCTDFLLRKIQIPPDVVILPAPHPDNEMYFLWCKNCPHKRMEIDYDQVEANKKVNRNG
jgi:predicted nucleic-acid-binding Zn-ribbon protein